jgi:hypothetical protein
MTDKLPEHDPKLTFMNENGDELGSLNFSGSALTFEGNAEQSALLFINIVDELFQKRLMQEYSRGYEDGKNFTNK